MLAKEEGIGDVEEVVGGHADADVFGVFGFHREVEKALEVGVDIGLVVVGGLGPVVLRGFHFFHGEVGSFHDADFDFGFASFGPSGELLERDEGVGEVGLEDDAGGGFGELRLVEGAPEGLASEVEVAVFLHVEIDEFARAIEEAEAFLDGGEGAFLVEEVDLGEDGGDLNGKIMAFGLGEEGEVLLKAVLCFFFSEDGFAEEVQVHFGASGEVGGEWLLFAGEDDTLAVFANLRSDRRHDETGEEAGGKGANPHEQALMGEEVVRDAMGCDEAAEGAGLGRGRRRAKDLVGEVEGEFFACGIC